MEATLAQANSENEDSIKRAMDKFQNVKSLRKEQRSAIKALVDDKRDTMVLLPTGYGKSLIYQLLPEVHKIRGDQRRIVIVVSPLTAIMKEQTQYLNKNGVRAAILEEQPVDKNNKEGVDKRKADESSLGQEFNVEKGDVDIVFASAEKWLSPKWKAELKTGNLSKLVSEIAIDEAHTVLQWGFKSVKGKHAKKMEPFRKEFGKVGDLKALLPECPLVALTASLRMSLCKTLQEVLHLKDPFKINASPNKDNVRMSVNKVKSREEALKSLDWLIEELREKRGAAPKTLLFCNVITDIAHVLSYLLMKLGNDAYMENDGTKHWLLGVYHAKTWESTKATISEDFQILDAKVRVIIATSALSMGVDYPDVRNIVHFGSPSRTLEGHIQELGRGGRDGKQSHDLVICTGVGLSNCESDVRKLFKDESCYRLNLFKHFDTDVSPLLIKHLCCSQCSKSCECDGTTSKKCSYDVPKFEKMKDACPEVEEHPVKRTVTDVDRKEMKAALEVERNRLTILEGGSSVSGEDQLHGFSSLLIEQVISKLQYLGTSKDIVHMLPIFSVSHARIILELIQEFFEDIENFENEIEELCDAEECTEETRELFTLMQEFYENDEELQEFSDLESVDDELDDLGVESALLEELGLSL